MFLRFGLASAVLLVLSACNCDGPGGGDAGSGGGSGAGGGGVAAGGGTGAGGGSGDAGPTDAGPDPDAGCGFGTATSLATPGNLDLFGTIAYFGDGGVLSPGSYRVQYVDGCMKYGGGQDWTIHAYADGHDAWWLVGDSTSQKWLMPPGTVGYSASNGAFVAFADCVTANLALPPTDFEFDGGRIGVWLQDSPYSDNMAGESGRNPAWNLTRRGACVAP